MEILNFIISLKNEGIGLSLDGENLEISFDGEELPTDLISNLRERKQEIVSYLKQISIDKVSVAVINKVEEQSSYELSSAQKRLWLLSKFSDSNAAYNTQGGYMFDGELNIPALKSAFNELLERHEIFRTVFKNDENGDVKQFVLSIQELGFEMEEEDLRGLENVEQKLVNTVQKSAEQTFDLAQGPLIKVKIYRIGEKQFFLGYVLHHIVADGWTMKLLLNEIVTLYESFKDGKVSPLPPLKLQYRDFAAWQLDQLQGDNLEAHKGYWLKQFSGELPVLNLLGDRPRPAVKSFQGYTISRVLDKSTLEGIKSLCVRQGATLFIGLMSLVKALLFKLTDQTDIIVGTPIAGRDHPDLENQMGLYLNMLALRSKFKKEDTFQSFMSAVKAEVLSAFDHQIYPLDELVDSLSLKADPSRNPLFDVVLVLQNLEFATGLNSSEQEQGDLESSEISAERMNLVEAKASKFDLTFDFQEFEGGLGMKVEYNSDILDSESAERIVDMFERLLNEVIADDTIELGKINYLSEQDKNLQLNEFNNTERDFDKLATVISMFKEQANRRPDHEALCFEKKSFTYQELDRTSEELAAFLKSKGIEHQDLIGIQQQRSEWTVISILALLKLGAAYLPLDVDYPEDRIAYMLKDSNVKFSICDKDIEEFISKREEFVGVEIEAKVLPSDLIYSMYTSGSTGQPKGILIEHRSVVNLLTAMDEFISLTEEDVVLNLTTMSFDAFVPELFLPLTRGLKLVLGNFEAQKSPVEVKRLIQSEKVTFVQMTPSRLSLVLDEGANLDNIKHLMVSGEVFPDDLYKRLKSEFHGVILNGYGPSETCVYATINKLENEHVNLGKPIGNTKIFILDDHMEMQPIGISGEICISGEGLARGYTNSWQHSDTSFVQNPFQSEKRIYRTGDLGRWKIDGTIEYLGRKDSQVKVRGYRIELGEIEKNLINHPEIKSAVVKAELNDEGDKMLLAYIIANEALTSTDVRTHLKTYLPAFMIPEYFIQMDSFPLSPSGKVDKKALPFPDGMTISSGVEYLAPENVIQEKLVAIWIEILDQDKIGILDNFFDLGGNSIQLIKMVDRVRKEFDRKVNYIEAFKFPNIETLAEFLSEEVKEQFEKFDKQVDESVDLMDETFNILNDL